MYTRIPFTNKLTKFITLPNRELAIEHSRSLYLHVSQSWVVCQSGVSRGVSRGATRGAGAGAGAGSGRGRVRKCCKGIPQRLSPGGTMVEPRGRVQEPLANRAGGGMPDVAFQKKKIVFINASVAILLTSAVFQRVQISNTR